VPRMRERGGGRIVNISSGTPFRGVPFLLHYVTSKGAIVAFTRALAKELGRDGIGVNCVAPGFTISTGVQEHPEVIEALRDVSVSARTIQRDQVPEDVVGAVVFLCTPAAGFITGQTMVIDGGQTFH
jgi:NAD(P)-dependent dehydrogenase (short-subunit alcohol dehydrogenase family)